MKILIAGSGGVGGYYGGLLARSGNEVIFLARGEHLKALRAHGLQVKSVHGDFAISPVQATDTPGEAGVVDLILFCTKTYDTETVARSLQPCVGSETAILSLQNGIDAAERIGAILGMEHMLGGATWISSAVEAPGVIRQFSQFRRIVFGELDGRITPRAQAIYQTLSASGATVELSTNILSVLWTKFVFIAAMSGISSLTRLEIGEFRHVPETRALMTALMREVEALARAQNIALDADVVEKTLSFVDASAPNIKSSMQRDVESGRRTELESMIGVICRKGREWNVPTPVADFVYAALLPVELKAQRASR
uniref:2-dehydropantoate 2-reductase n=1 Tax=uncultured Chloroflexota bacterium TaxID=166587 RepID=H5SBB2_9CHLR|nr:2-dehydropantoate 2-reductase [uncultured Chloroflexota bacterium]